MNVKSYLTCTFLLTFFLPIVDEIVRQKAQRRKKNFFLFILVSKEIQVRRTPSSHTSRTEWHVCINDRAVPEPAHSGLDPRLGIFDPLSYQATGENEAPPPGLADWLRAPGSRFFKRKHLTCVGRTACQSAHSHCSIMIVMARRACSLQSNT